MLILNTPTNFQYGPDVINLMGKIIAAFRADYGFDLDITQSDPIKETAGGETGCTWNASCVAYPNGGTFPVSPGDTRDPYGIAATISGTLYTENYVQTRVANGEVEQAVRDSLTKLGSTPADYKPPKPAKPAEGYQNPPAGKIGLPTLNWV
jgi:hypothetical protein